MEIFLAFAFIGIVIWLFCLQDSLSSLRFKVNLLEKELAQKTKVENDTSARAALHAVEAESKTEETVASQGIAEEPLVVKPAHTGKVQSVAQEKVKADFMVAKWFSWIGGFLLLLGIIFWLKYAIENGLISPAMRILLGGLLGLGLWTTGSLIKQERLKITATTLCAIGISVCYAVCFAGYHFYHLLSQTAAFTLLALIALGAFATAVWKDSKFIGVFAQLIGFLMPALFRIPMSDALAVLLFFVPINLVAVASAYVRKWDHQIYSCMGFTALFLLSMLENGPAVLGRVDFLFGFILFFALLYAGVAVLRKKGGFLVAASLISALFFAFAGIGSLGAYWIQVLSWISGVFVIFMGVPFVFKQFRENERAWIANVFAGLIILCFFIFMLHKVEKPFWPVPAVLALVYGGMTRWVYGWDSLQEKVQQMRLTWVGGAALFFLTLTLACKLEKEWLTIALALEGFILIWMNAKRAHPVLPWFGKALFALAGVRLLINPAISDYYTQTNKFFNWYLYTYGLAAGLTWGAARLYEPKKNKGGVGFLYGLFGAFVFAWMNLEIANYFCDGRLSMKVFDSFAASATYTFAWALFGVGCLLLSLKYRLKGTRLTGFMLVGIALLKLLLNDVWQLAIAPRIAVLIGVAILLLAASFLYQKKRSK